MKIITRTKYLDRIVELNGTPDIKIITGIRRSGKSKLMQAYIEYLKGHFENINIIFIDFMDLAYEEIKEYHALHAYVEKQYQEGKTNYLFVDEVQMCPKFELAINSLYSKGKYDIYVTGSNAFLLSADLATLFTGRYIEIHVFPFSFQEYCQYYEDVSDKDKLFEDYSIKGGLAGNSEIETKYHTATHLLNAALKVVISPDTHQRGSNITSERMRFDFNCNHKLTDEEKLKVEELVNEWIKEGLEVRVDSMSKQEALASGAECMFIEKYPDVVTVYSIGDVSKELCGGPHVKNTNELGHFKIKKEEASSAGVRRIKAVLE